MLIELGRALEEHLLVSTAIARRHAVDSIAQTARQLLEAGSCAPRLDRSDS